MDHIVYLLGAGFSAPLGLPVMRNFLIRSKDMYAAEPDRYAHFAEVFDCINELSRIQSYYDADLFNIEEILSILEMRDQIGGKQTHRRFVRYIKDVIEYYTPPPPGPPGASANWYDHPLKNPGAWLPYFYFALSLLNVSVEFSNSFSENRFSASLDEKPVAKYSVVTLNYDRALETWSQFLTNHYRGGGRFRFDTSTGDSRPIEPTGPFSDHTVPLLKLHGSVNDETIMAPTWNKGVPKNMAKIWEKAHEVLSSANQIRIIGYSLPVADAYLKYLLKSAVVKAPNLKAIDVICRDNNGATLARYKEFIRLGYARFVNADVISYLTGVRNSTVKSCSVTRNSPVPFRQLERAHEEFFEQSSNL